MQILGISLRKAASSQQKTLEYILNNLFVRDFQMDIEGYTAATNWKNVFHSIQQFPIHLLQQKKVISQNVFYPTAKHTPTPFVLTLIEQYLILSEGSIGQSVPIAAANLSFELKFQVLHQIQNNLTSPKIGISFYQDQAKTCNFYAEDTVVEIWAQHLADLLHQKGFHERFKPLRKLGKGNFATVYEVERFSDGKKFAVKAFSKQTCFAANRGKESLINELQVMRELSKQGHKNILKLQGVYESSNSIYIVLDLLNGGQLFHRIQERNGHFTPTQVRECMFGLVSGLAHMHKRRIMHRDIKPENIMLRDEASMQPVIVDFGLATNADVQKYLFFRCGTPGYVAPEIIALSQTGHVNPECDIFSIGVIFHIFLTRKPLFEGNKYQEVYKNNKEMNFRLEGQNYEGLNPQALDLLRKMLVADPDNRITAAESVSHPYFAGLCKDDKFGSPSLTAASVKNLKIAR